jgi:hypothetical protein
MMNEYLKEIRPTFNSVPAGLTKLPHFFNSFAEIGWPDPSEANETL